jgi:hypothetical protein
MLRCEKEKGEGQGLPFDINHNHINLKDKIFRLANLS